MPSMHRLLLVASKCRGTAENCKCSRHRTPVHRADGRLTRSAGWWRVLGPEPCPMLVCASLGQLYLWAGGPFPLGWAGPPSSLPLLLLHLPPPAPGPTPSLSDPQHPAHMELCSRCLNLHMRTGQGWESLRQGGWALSVVRVWPFCPLVRSQDRPNMLSLSACHTTPSFTVPFCLTLWEAVPHRPRLWSPVSGLR